MTDQDTPKPTPPGPFEGRTPGPWHRANLLSSNKLTIVASGDHVVAEARRPDTLEGAANARLIAAAPDILAEVERLREEVDERRKEAQGWIVPSVHERLNEIAAQRAALGKEVERLTDERAEALTERGNARQARDRLRGILATTADRLNTALRENGLKQVDDDYHQSLAIRDGINDLWERLAKHRVARSEAEAQRAALVVALEKIVNACSDADGMDRDPVLAHALARAALAQVKEVAP